MAWSKDTPKEVIREYDRQYRENNKDKIQQQDRDYYGRISDKSSLTNQKAIYYLKDINGVPFYVGSTINPDRRMADHLKKGRQGTMVVLKYCPTNQVVYWESKLIVDLTELGYTLENLLPPNPSKPMK